MKENLDLVEILKNCPKGTPLYSLIHGDVELESVDAEDNTNAINVYATHDDKQRLIAHFTQDGRYFIDYGGGECVLFPSRDCRDWAKFNQPKQQFKKGDHILFRHSAGNEFLGVFEKYVDGGRCSVTIFGDVLNISEWELPQKDLTKLEKFDPKLLKTGDAVLVRDGSQGEWTYTNFSHITSRAGERVFCACCCAWRQCVPYNQETKDLIGTYYGAPKFYDLTEK